MKSRTFLAFPLIFLMLILTLQSCENESSLSGDQLIELKAITPDDNETISAPESVSHSSISITKEFIANEVVSSIQRNSNGFTYNGVIDQDSIALNFSVDGDSAEYFIQVFDNEEGIVEFTIPGTFSSETGFEADLSQVSVPGTTLAGPWWDCVVHFVTTMNDAIASDPYNNMICATLNFAGGWCHAAVAAAGLIYCTFY